MADMTFVRMSDSAVGQDAPAWRINRSAGGINLSVSQKICCSEFAMRSSIENFRRNISRIRELEAAPKVRLQPRK
jgi:hypothetical protein